MVNKEFQVEGEYTWMYVPGEYRMGVSYSLGWGITKFQRNGEVGGGIRPFPHFLNPFPFLTLSTPSVKASGTLMIAPTHLS